MFELTAWELYLLHVGGLLVTIVVSVLTAVWVRKQAWGRASQAMVGLLLAHALMAAFGIGLLTSTSGAWMKLWGDLIMAFVLVLPVVWYLFAVYYTGYDHWLTPPVRVGVVAAAVAVGLFSMTDAVHGLLYAETSVATAPFPFLQYDPSGVLRGLLLVMYLLFAVAVGLLARLVVFSRRNTRLQIVALLTGIAAIGVTMALSWTAYVPLTGFPYGIYGSGVFGVLVAIGLFRTRLFAVAPLARDALFESIDDGVLVVDDNHRIVDFNATAADLFPAFDEHVGDRLGEVYPALLAAEGTDRGDIPTAEFRQETAFANTLTATDGNGKRTLRTAASSITSGGQTRGYAVIIRDVTELEAYASELERRTEQLERFADVLSHDLRNPVAVAKGYIGMEIDERESEHLSTALDAVDRIDETIDDLLTLAQEGEAIDEPEVVSFRQVIEDAWNTSDVRGVVLENRIDTEREIRADPSRLRTMFENLFRNVADHGGDTVAVEWTGDGFAVSDDGPGIPKSERDAVLAYGYTNSDTGTGFGLAIVASIVDAHGWSIAISESEAGGARFDISSVRSVG